MNLLAAARCQAKLFNFATAVRIGQAWPFLLLAQPGQRWSVVHQAGYAAAYGHGTAWMDYFIGLCPEAAALRNRDGQTPQDRLLKRCLGAGVLSHIVAQPHIYIYIYIYICICHVARIATPSASA